MPEWHPADFQFRHNHLQESAIKHDCSLIASFFCDSRGLKCPKPDIVILICYKVVAIFIIHSHQTHSSQGKQARKKLTDFTVC